MAEAQLISSRILSSADPAKIFPKDASPTIGNRLSGSWEFFEQVDTASMNLGRREWVIQHNIFINDEAFAARLNVGLGSDWVR